MRRFIWLVLLMACKKHEPAVTDASMPAAPARDGHAIAAGACLSCHSEEMLAQQRLTPAQWNKVVTKMIGWGAPVDGAEVAPLTEYLAAHYGPDAGPYVASDLSASAAVAELAPQDDGPFAGGDPTRGRALFAERCAACHGPEARGSLGVNLVDRPSLYRAGEFAGTVRRGRGKMPPLALSDPNFADLLAFLRTLR